jgi:hypothetical protein
LCKQSSLHLFADIVCERTAEQCTETVIIDLPRPLDKELKERADKQGMRAGD